MKSSPRVAFVPLIALLAAAAFPPPAWASFAAVPLEILVDQADVIVVGKVVKVKDAGFAVGVRKFDAAVVKVSAVLKTKKAGAKGEKKADTAADDDQFPAGGCV